MNSNTRDSSLNKYFDCNGAARSVIINTIKNARVVRIATAYFQSSGYQCIREILKGKRILLLIGRPDAGEDKVREIVQEFMDTIMEGPSEDRTEAIRELRDALESGAFLISVSRSSDSASKVITTMGVTYVYHHAKVYISDADKAVITSSNFTWSGLVKSIEAGLVTKDREEVAYFKERFDEYYTTGIPIAKDLLDILNEWLTIYKPYEIYIKSLLEIYGLPETDEPGRLPELAGYQKPVVSRLLSIIEFHNGGFLIASTGLGKTIITAHVLAYLRSRNKINEAIIICPTGLKEMWHRVMRAAFISSDEFSYNTLSEEDWKRNSHMERLESDLKRVTGQSVIILDESHRMRNAYNHKEEKLSFGRIRDAVKKGAKLILLTATPYSKDISDINSQLMLFPGIIKKDLMGEHMKPWSVNKAMDLSELDNSIVLTAPCVIKYFSHREKDDRYVLFSGNEKRYFPKKLHIKNIHYDNIIDDDIEALLNGNILRLRDENPDQDENCLFDEDMCTGRRSGSFEAQVMHQGCSSLARFLELLGKLEKEGGYERLRFEKQEELTLMVKDMREKIFPYIEDQKTCDDKMNKTIDIISGSGSNKVLIFCHYEATTKYVIESLRERLPDKKIESTLDKSQNEIDRIIKGFAPIANEVYVAEENDTEKIEEIDILIATGSMTEGFNLQDAPVLINFDLPWTVLILAQRLGRILRPWHEPRELYVYNLFPSTMNREHIEFASNWQERLKYRNKEMSSFSEIPVIVEKSTPLEMIDLAKAMQKVGNTDLDVDQVYRFIENADGLATSSFIDDLAKITEKLKKTLKRLPLGIKSFKKTKKIKEERMYVLFKYKKRVFPLVFSREAKIEYNSDMIDEIMQLIRSEKKEDPVYKNEGFSETDVWLDNCKRRFCRERDVDSTDVAIICYMVLLPD